MKKIKFSNSKWFLENNGEWIEIEEKDWEELKEMIHVDIVTWEPLSNKIFELNHDFYITEHCIDKNHGLMVACPFKNDEDGVVQMSESCSFEGR